MKNPANLYDVYYMAMTVRQLVSADKITGLVLTHHDHDHMGAADTLKRMNPHMKIYASAAEAPFISAQEKPLRLHQAEEMQRVLPPEQQDFGKAFCNMLRRVEPVEVDSFLCDGDRMDWCGGCSILATPGHTPGHISSDSFLNFILMSFRYVSYI